MTSRAAENLFWLGRYTERAENSRSAVVRLALATLRSSQCAGPRRWLGAARAAHWCQEACRRRCSRARVRARPRARDAGAAGATSVAFNLRALRRCAQALRERLSQEHWKLIQELDDHFEEDIAAALAQSAREGGLAPVSDVVTVLGRTATQLGAVTGAQTDRMVRDDGWRLLSVGRQIERPRHPVSCVGAWPRGRLGQQ